jgi:hypothetical protein
MAKSADTREFVMRKRWWALLAAIIIIDVMTYLSLCRPEMMMAKADPSGYAYLARIRADAGGIWSLSPGWRCAVHLVAMSLMVCLIGSIVSYLASRRKALP